jgi:2'-5' RNA ligase
MLAVASLFNSMMNEATRRLWDDLDTRCFLSGIKITPIPHFSWHVAFGYSEGINAFLQEFATRIKPFHVQTSGLGVFGGKTQVIYVPILKSFDLMALHINLYQNLEKFADSSNLNYSPDRWVPHLTIGYGDVTPEKIGCAAKALAFRNMQMEILVDNLSIIYNENNHVGITVNLPFVTKGEDNL